MAHKQSERALMSVASVMFVVAACRLNTLMTFSGMYQQQSDEW